MYSLEKVRSVAETSGDPYELARYLRKMVSEVEQLREQLRSAHQAHDLCPHCRQPGIRHYHSATS